MGRVREWLQRRSRFFLSFVTHVDHFLDFAGSSTHVGVGRNNGRLRPTPDAAATDPCTLQVISRTLLRGRLTLLVCRPGFCDVDTSISAFQLSIPRQYFTELPVSADPHLALLHAVPYASVILLHSPFVTKEQDDLSAQRCLAAAHSIFRAILTYHSE